MAGTSTRRGFVDFSPVKRGDADKENAVPVLSLLQFSTAPFVAFGTVKLGTAASAVLRVENPTEDAEARVVVEKVPSSKGFSADRGAFTIQPGGSFSLTLTWTPTEEGGIRELVLFSANGVLKHQAVLLGRAEAPKKKKKSLWDTIKSKREADAAAVPRRRKAEPPLKMAANKTFQVSRKQQYKRDKPRSPLASLNDGKAVGERSLAKRSPTSPRQTPDHTVLNPKHGQQALDTLDQENIHAQKNSPLILLVPGAKMRDSGNASTNPEVLASKPENKDLSKVLNITLSPIGTPERFKTFMPHNLLESPVPAAVKPDADDADRGLSRTPVPSLKDALALIDSDLSRLNSSHKDSSSSCDFSDSLEFESKIHGCGSDGEDLKALPGGLEPSESNKPRLTFFVSKKVAVSEFVSEAEPNTVAERVKKAAFTSATVTKGKAPVDANCSSGRKIKKSRRRLLEKTLELTDGSDQCESGPETTSRPVIHGQVGAKKWQNSEASSSPCDGRDQVLKFMSSSPAPRLGYSPPPVTFPITSPPSTHLHSYVFSCTSPLPAVPDSTAFNRLPASLPTSPHLTGNVCEQPPTVSAPPSVQEDLFPIHMAVNGKKRKSEEFLKRDARTEGVRKTDHVKRSRVVAVKVEPTRSAQERRSVPQRQQLRPAGSVRSKTSSSLKSTKPALAAQTKQPSSRRSSRGAASLPSAVKAAKVVAVAQSTLAFVKPAQTAIPRHPMPFAAKNMFYDERWVEKQERGFTWWINYVLTPDDFKVSTEVSKVNAVSLAMGSADAFTVPKAPTKEELSFSTYTARRKLNRLRRAACRLFASDAMVKAIQRLELEVEAKRLLVRKDRHLWKDIGERRKVLNWLLSYNPLWLRIGLETIYGELISLESNSDALGLALFILHRLLWSPDLAAEFRHPKVPHLYREGHEEALSRFTLKKLLLLVCFLDRAKASRLIEHDPCLFCVDAEFKTSKDLLLAFSRDFLSGEGILPRHLGYLGLPVSHAQTPLDEFDFAVRNLAVDLKCGVRLVRVMELLVKDWTLSPKLRLPAVSRLQKVHNVDIALHVLKSKGIDLKDEYGSTIDSRDIVDGHREKTLSLLWKIISAFHVEVVLDKNQLMEEIAFLRKTLKIKRRLLSLRADRGLQPSPEKSWSPCEGSSTKVALLMSWVRAVCDFYNLKVENFTVAFSDGRVLCFLLHHYHPSLLPEEAVSQRTTQTAECSPRGRLQLDCSPGDSDGSFDSSHTGPDGPDSPSVEFKQLLENEKNNFRLVNSAVAFLGGVPAMINPADMSNTIPSEKVVVSYLSFLCARLLDLCNEARAARVIQGAWRRCRLKKDLQLYEERNTAALRIQAVVRSFLRRCRAKRQHQAAVTIQAVWRGHACRSRLRLHKEARRQALRHKAATVIQTHWRMFSDMRSYQRLRHYATVVQAQWRMRVEASAYRRIYWAATVVQKRSRARKERERYLLRRAAVVTLQRAYRRWKGWTTERENCAARVIQAMFKKWHQRRTATRAAAAVRIQAWYRMQRCLRRYRTIRRSVVLLQAQYRGHVQRRSFQALQLRHRAAAVIQRAVRRWAARQRLAKRRLAVLTIQSWFRASVKRDAAKRMFARTRRATIAMQAAYRGKVARALLRKQHRAATVIQAAFRRYAARSRFLVLRRAATLLQRKYRATTLARETKQGYDALRNAALVVQAHWRGRADRRRMKKQRRCATVIQAHYRRHRAQAEYRSRRAAAVVLQRRYRAYVAGKEARRAHLRTRAACVALQAAFRGTRVRTELKKRQQAATVVQSSVRMFLCRKRYVLLQSASIVIQSRYRALLLCRAQQSEYRALQRAATTLQAAYRGCRIRADMRRRRDAATIIQARFRMHRMRAAYLATKRAAVIVQERFRAKRLRDRQLRRYEAMKSAAVIIQAAHRGHRARRRMAAMRRAAAIVQRTFLATRDRKRFLAVKEAILVCQRRYRAVTLARRLRLDYLSKRRAVICLQAAYRAREVRKQMHIQHTAALTIQTHYRRSRHRTYYKRLCWAAVVLQRRYRANKRMTEEMSALQAKRRAAVALQAAFRGMKARKTIKQKHQAASVIQRAYKTHSERRRYLTLKASVLTVQTRYRATAAAKQHVEKYQRTRRAAVVLQAAFRGRRVRRDVAHWHQAATVIQSAFRKHRELVKFQAMCLAAIIIQRSYRGLVLQRQERKRFLNVRRAAVVLQAAFRGQCLRSSVAEMHRAAAVIQANYKRHRCQSAFRRQLWAAGVLQQRFRARRQRNADLKRYGEVREAAITLQAAFRGTRARRILKQSHRAASVIQRAYRTRCEHRKYLTLKTFVLNIQRRFRATLAAKQQMLNYQTIHRAAVVLQAAFRGRRVRRDVAHWHQAATVIQSAFRKHRECVNFQAMRLAAMIIQRRYRACILQRQERERFLNMRRAAVALQAAFRGRHVRASVAEMHKAAAVIQANYKRHRCQSAFRRQLWAAGVLQQRFRARRQRNADSKRYGEVREAAITLQAAFRGTRARRILRQSHRAASVIQRANRAHSERKRYLVVKSSVLAIQSKYRATVWAKAQRREYLGVRGRVLVLQAAYRGWHVRKEVARLHQAATVVQSVFRKHRELLRFQAVRLSAIIVQRRRRACVLQRREREAFLRVKRATVLLQAACRGWFVRRDIRRRTQAAVVIQSTWRCSVQRRVFLKKREAAVKLQRWVRAVRLGAQERNAATRRRRAVSILQTHCRAWIARKRVLEAARAERRLRFTAAAYHHLSAIRLQRALRAHWALESAKRQIHSVLAIQQRVRAWQQRRRYLDDRRKVVVVQRAVKHWLVRRHGAAAVVQRAVRRFLLLKRQKRVEAGIVKAQALWRGHRSRRLNDNPEVVKLRHRLRQVSARVREEERLCNKTSSALDFLLRYKQFSYILEALKNLDTATRLSPECCVRLVESGATSVIFTLIRCCNRSVPCMDVITFSIQILLNLSKYHRTIEAVYSVDNSVETLLDLLQRYREKAGDKVAERGGSIFTKACFLLALLLQDKRRAVDVMKMPRASDRILSIYRLTARKHKMDAERSVMKQKMNASLTGSFFVRATPRKSRPAAKFAPEWVLRKDKLNDIVDPLRAIRTVAAALAIEL